MNRKLKEILQMVGLIGLGILLLLVTKETTQTSPEVAAIQVPQLNQSAKVSPGYTLYPISGPELINLINLDGKIVHQWDKIDVTRARILPNCNLITLHGSKFNLTKKPWSDLLNRVSEYDWEGNLTWSYTADFHLHHDLQRLANGNTLLMMHVPLPQSELQKIKDPVRRKFEIIADVIIEVDPSGEVIWKWNSWDYLEVNSCGHEACLGQAETPLDSRELRDIADWTHFNTLSVLPENQWFDQGDQRFRPGNIMTVARNFSEILIIDRLTGEIVWRYNGNYKGGMVGGHDATMIPKDTPGAGNILVFDNGFDQIREESYILEVNPISKDLVWFYDQGKKFYSRARGGVQRLPNGNTLISEDRAAKVFEVNPQGKIVWEYQGGGRIILRAHRYPPNYCPKFQELS